MTDDPKGGAMTFPRQPPELERLGKGRYGLEGHRQACTGTLSLSIRMHEGRYRIVRGCECGANREIAPTGFETYGAAEAMLGFGWWR